MNISVKLIFGDVLNRQVKHDSGKIIRHLRENLILACAQNTAHTNTSLHPHPSVLSQLKTLLIQILISENTVMAQLPLRSVWLGCMAGGYSDKECHLRAQGIQPFIKGIVKLADLGNDSEDLTSFSSLLDRPSGWGPVLSPSVCLLNGQN